jgi:O-antigen/teichoic acid export membrane protein
MSTPTITRQSVAGALSWAGVGQLVSQGTWFASLLVLAAMVPPRAFGVVSAGMVIVSIAVLLVGSGTRGSIIVAKRLEPEQLRYALWLTTGAGLALTAVVMLLAGPIVSAFASRADPSVLQGLILSVGMFGLSIVPMAVLQKQMQFRREATVMSLASIFASIAAIVAAVLGAGIWALVGRQVLWSVLIALFAWVAARRLLPNWRHLIGRPKRPDRARRPDAGWFFLLALFSLVAMSVDYLIVGRLTNATQLGLYSLAFSLAFAPLTQISWRLGGVLLPAVAASTPEAVSRRTLLAMRTMATFLLPAVPVAVVLAPWLLPTIFGARWTGMVTPFQILLPVGVAQAVLNMVGESLAGSGSVHIHAKMHMVWAVLIIPALLVLVRIDGITGAALAHLVVLVPVAAGYMFWGARTLGLRPGAVAFTLREIALPVALQAAITALVAVVLQRAGTPAGVRDTLAALSGLAVIGTLGVLHWRDRLRDARNLIFALVGRGSEEPSRA